MTFIIFKIPTCVCLKFFLTQSSTKLPAFSFTSTNFYGWVSKYILVSGRAHSSALFRTFRILPIILECLCFQVNFHIVLLSLEYPISFSEQPVIITYPTSWGFSFFRDWIRSVLDWGEQAQRRKSGMKN